MQQTRRLETAMKRLDIIQKALREELTWVQAAEILGLSARQVRRIRRNYERHGEKSLLDKRYGFAPRNKKSSNFVRKVLALYRDEYRDFNVQHFHEKLWEEHQIQVSYSWLKCKLQGVGLVAKGTKPGTYRGRRERRPMAGMMLQMDGSDHHWLGDDLPAFDLVAIIDDASNEVYSGFFAEEENTRSVFEVLRETITKKGLFCTLYSDRASHFFYTNKAGGRVDSLRKTQCQRAMERLGIQMLPSYSPQARGRIERLWKTFQGRLPQELKRAKIKTISQANEYLQKIFIPDYNKKFTVPPKQSGSAFTPVHPTVDLDRIFSIQNQRVVRNDNTVSYKNKLIQLPKTEYRYCFAKCEVTVYEHLNEDISIGMGPKTLARFDSSGKLKTQKEKPKKKTGT